MTRRTVNAFRLVTLDLRTGAALRILVNALSVAPGGGSIFAEALLKELSGLCSSDKYVVLVKDDHLQASRTWSSNVEFRQVHGIASSGPLRVVWEQTVLRRVFRLERCDLLFGIGGFGLLWGHYSQVVVAQNALFYEVLPSENLRSRLRRRVQRVLQLGSVRAGACVVCVSSYIGDKVLAAVGAGDLKMSVIPHGTDMRPPTDAVERRTSIGSRAVLLWVGVDSPHKDLDTLLEALPEVERRTGKSVELRIAGHIDADQSEMIFARGAALGVAATPVFLGYLGRENLRQEYLQAAVLVSTSLVESSDMSVLEAMAVGTPVVGSDISVRDAARSSMRTFSAGSADDLAAVLADVLLDDVGRSRMVASGLAAAEGASWRASALQYRRVFGTCVSLVHRR